MKYVTKLGLRLQPSAQPSNVSLSENNKVANFDPFVVREELEREQPSPLRHLFSLRNLERTIIGETWQFLVTYLVLYYFVQIAFQLNIFCGIDGLSTYDVEYSGINRTSTETCRNTLKTYFTHWEDQTQNMTRLITFLLGFYVTMITKRWWDQVSKIPDADHLSLSIGGFIIADPKTKDAGHHLKKTVLRYALLSWTMCLSRISGPLRKQFPTTQQYINKKLMTLEEAHALKIDLYSPSCTSKWWIPLAWAISLVNDAYNIHGIIGKDQKQVIVVLCNLRNDLYNLAEYRLKPLPAIYKQAVWAAVWGWMILGIVANQNTILHMDNGATFGMVFFLGFPIHGLLMYMLIFGWLKVADVLSNPFGNDIYDINLASKLDLNIWKASVTLENQDNQAFNSSFLRNPYLEEKHKDEEKIAPTTNVFIATETWKR